MSSESLVKLASNENPYGCSPLVKKFLNDGCKLKITLIFRGRELSRIDLGKDVMDRVIEELSEVAEVEKDIPLEGRRMSVVLSAKQ